MEQSTKFTVRSCHDWVYNQNCVCTVFSKKLRKKLQNVKKLKIIIEKKKDVSNIVTYHPVEEFRQSDSVRPQVIAVSKLYPYKSNSFICQRGNGL